MNGRHSSDACLDRRTLAIIRAGRCPIDQVDKLRTHLPECSRCRAAIAASTGRRARGGDTVVLTPAAREPSAAYEPRLALRVGLVLLSLLSVAAVVWLTPAGANVRAAVEHSLWPSSADRAAHAGGLASPLAAPPAAASR